MKKSIVIGSIVAAMLFAVLASGTVFGGMEGSQRAAALTSGQVNAIIELLEAFGADQETVESVRRAISSEETIETTGTGEEVVADEASSNKPEETSIVSGTPVCSVVSSLYFPLEDETFEISWNAENAEYVTFSPDTTNAGNKKDLVLPEGKQKVQGSAETISYTVNKQFVSLAAYNSAGEQATCQITINVQEKDATGNYRGMMNGVVFAETSGILKNAAVENCKQKAEKNENATVSCTWNADVVYTSN